MNIRKEIHYTFNENDIRQLVAEAIKAKHGFEVDLKNITIRVNETRQGMGHDDEYAPASFNCVEVKVVQN